MPKADLVLEGGGVKGTGLLGAVTAMVEWKDDPYEFQRICRDVRRMPSSRASLPPVTPLMS